MNPEDIADENLRNKLDAMGAFSSGFYHKLQKAKKEHKRVEVYSKGTYKGVQGIVIAIEHGIIDLKTATGITSIMLTDVRRISVFDDGDAEK